MVVWLQLKLDCHVEIQDGHHYMFIGGHLGFQYGHHVMYTYANQISQPFKGNVLSSTVFILPKTVSITPKEHIISNYTYLVTILHNYT